MVAEFIKKWNTPALRKYVSDHNKVIRFHIGKEIKEARVAYSKFLKVKRRDLKAAQEINIKGMKKNQIIEAILKEPVLMKRIKDDIDNKRAPTGFHYMEGGVIMKGDKHGGEKKEEGGGAAEKKKIKLVTFYDDEPKKSNLKTVTKEDIKELGKGKKKRRIVVKESKSLPEVPKPKGKTKDPNAPEPPKRKVKKPKILPETPKPKEKKKKELPKTPLTVTRADGSVSVLKKRVRDKRSILDRKAPETKKAPVPKKESFEKELKIAMEYGNEIKKLKEKYSVKILKDLYSKPDGKNKKVELGKLITKDFKEVIAERKKLLKKTKDNKEIKKIMDKAFEEIEKIRDNVFDIPVELKMPKKSEVQVKKAKEEKEAFEKAIKPKEEPKPKAKAKPKPKPISDEAKKALKEAREEAKKAQEEREKLRGKKPKLIKEIPSRLKEKWFRYMVSQYDDEPFSPADQLDEYEQLKELADEYFENQEIRRDKSLKAAEQSKGGSRVMSITETVKEIINDDEDNNKKLIKSLFPKLFDALYK